MNFTQASIDFLVENRLNDNRTWYAEHKEQYQTVLLQPFIDLVTELTPFMRKIDPLFVTEPRVDRTISRIYRDTRFSKDKSLYRDNMWLVFGRNKKQFQGTPEFYFDMGPYGFSYGMGYYQASAEMMSAMRDMVIEAHPSFVQADKAYRNQTKFVMEGDSYKRSKYPLESIEKKEWLDKKGISFNRHCEDFDLLFSKQLGEELIKDYQLLVPIYTFLCKTVERSTRENA